MALTLTTFASGAVIDATTMRARIATIEQYLNEQIANADKDQTLWVTTDHLFAPEFFGAPDPHARFPSGATHFRHVRPDNVLRTVHHQEVGPSQYVPVPGLQATLFVPEALDAGAGLDYRLMVRASFYAFELGGQGTNSGVDASLEGPAPVAQAATIALFFDGTAQAGTLRYLWASGNPVVPTPGVVTYNWNGCIFNRKMYAYTWSSPTVSAGLHHVGVYVRVNATAAPTPSWRHIFFDTRNLVASYYVR